MKMRVALKLAVVSAGAVLLPRSLWACAACFGQSDSPMAAGMNWGILTLLGMIVFVLGGVAGFFFFLIRRSTRSTPGSQAALARSWDANWPVTAETAQGLDNEPWQRSGLKRDSALAQRRKHCAHSQASPPPLAARNRS
jgi:hypothetical protein